MYTELFRTKLESKSLEDVKKAFQEATGGGINGCFGGSRWKSLFEQNAQ